MMAPHLIAKTTKPDLTVISETSPQSLGQAMRIIEDTPVLPAGILNQGGPEDDTFRPNETVDMIMESVSIYDMGAIWDVAKPNVQISIGYVARMIGLESPLELTEAGNVQTRVFRPGKVLQP